MKLENPAGLGSCAYKITGKTQIWGGGAAPGVLGGPGGFWGGSAQHRGVGWGQTQEGSRRWILDPKPKSWTLKMDSRSQILILDPKDGS